MDPDRTVRRRLAKIERLLAAGSIDEALRRCEAEQQKQPGRPETAAMMARLLVAKGRPGAAIGILERMLGNGPAPVELVHDLGIAHQAAGQNVQAERRFREVLDSAPAFLPALLSLGQLLEATGRIQEAEALYRAHEGLGGATGIAMLTGLARTLMSQARLDEAGQVYDRLAGISPGLPEAIAGRARIMEIEGRSQAAHDLLKPLVSGGEANAELLMIFGRLLNQLERPAQAREVLTAALVRSDLNAELTSRLRRHLAQSMDMLGDQDGAMRLLHQAHAGRGQFSESECVSQTQCLIDYFKSSPRTRAESADAAGPIPVFIVGMPRAGSSLLEQVLAAHSDVVAGGERSEFLNLADAWGGIGSGNQQFPARLASVSSQWSADFVRRYNNALPVTAGTRCTTDKMPPNFLFLGLIQSLFPGARIIDCRRDPLDAGLSCYFQEFSGHWFDFCHDLRSIGVYYREYRRLMNHWRETLALPMLEVHYEKFVADFPAQIERVLDFIGLEWQESCLTFFESTRRVRTASHAQVRKPVYQGSVGRHRPYLEWLKPMTAAWDDETRL